jgi:hypothetical protein
MLTWTAEEELSFTQLKRRCGPVIAWTQAG